MHSSAQQAQIDCDGFTILPSALDPTEVTRWIDELEGLFSTDEAVIMNRRGAVYAARNLLSSLPECCDVSKNPDVAVLLRNTLGEGFGLVRGLYFDKHPERTWSLPWHKDLTIAVKDNSLPSSRFTKPTNKRGVAHVEAPEAVLEQMLTIRIHLDDVTLDNGPLEVAVGSHAHGKQPDACHEVRKILVQAGDVLAMRPMISHASGSSTPGNGMHRRILHLEFAAQFELADGYQWHQFIRAS